MFYLGSTIKQHISEGSTIHTNINIFATVKKITGNHLDIKTADDVLLSCTISESYLSSVVEEGAYHFVGQVISGAFNINWASTHDQPATADIYTQMCTLSEKFKLLELSEDRSVVTDIVRCDMEKHIQ